MTPTQLKALAIKLNSNRKYGSNRKLALLTGYRETYISSLMRGTKPITDSFLYKLSQLKIK